MTAGRLSSTIVTIFTLLIPFASHAGDTSDHEALVSASPDQVQAIKKQLAYFSAAWGRGDAEGIARNLYTDSLVVTGEGLQYVLRDKKQIAAAEANLIAAYSAATFAIYSMRAAGPDLVYSTVSVSVTPRDNGKSAEPTPTNARALYVWKKTARGWLVDMEMYSFGEAKSLCEGCKPE